MTGVKGYIRENLPKTWEIILLRNKCLGSFIEQFYQAIAKPKNRNKYCPQKRNYNIVFLSNF